MTLHFLTRVIGHTCCAPGVAVWAQEDMIPTAVDLPITYVSKLLHSNQGCTQKSQLACGSGSTEDARRKGSGAMLSGASGCSSRAGTVERAPG